MVCAISERFLATACSRALRYTTAGAIAKLLGLFWGGDWTIEKDDCLPDSDHLQLPNWRTA
jgi:hypothetical protein